MTWTYAVPESVKSLLFAFGGLALWTALAAEDGSKRNQNHFKRSDNSTADPIYSTQKLPP